MPRRKIQKIIDQNGNLYFSPEYDEKDRRCLERRWEEDEKRILEEKKRAQAEFNSEMIGGPVGGPWLSGHQLLEKGLPPFKLFDFVFHGLQSYDPKTGQETWLLDEMPNFEHLQGREKYPSELKEKAADKLLSCVYRESDLLKIPELAAIIKPGSAEGTQVLEIEKEHPSTFDLPQEQGTAAINEQFVFKKTGPGWSIFFEGKELGPFKNKGFAYIHHCIENSHKSFSAVELYKAVNAGEAPNTLKSLPVEAGEDEERFQITSGVPNKAEDPKADQTTVKSIQKRLQDINILLEEAQDNHDIQGIPALKRKRDELMGELGKYQWKSKSKVVKKIFSNDETRVSGSIFRAISRSLEELRKHNELAYEHFSHAFKPISHFPKKYKPAKKIPWILS